MKISWHYLNELIDLKELNILEVTEKLTLAGLEVENIHYDKEIHDTIFDISITTNRPDLKGFINIATELSAILTKPLKIEEIKLQLFPKDNPYIIKDLTLQNIDSSSNKYLHKLNIETKDISLNIINFINLKWGQKIKAYQLEYINKNVIEQLCNNNNIKYIDQYNIKHIGKNKKINFFVLINHQRYNCYSLHAYEEIFRTLKVRKEQITQAAREHHPSHINTKNINSITCEVDKINKILGPINKTSYHCRINKIVDILQKLNIQANVTHNHIKINIPQERIDDLQYAVDIAEEVGRIYGFTHFIDKLPFFEDTNTNSNLSWFKNKTRRILRSMGLHEVITSSFQETNTTRNFSIINPINKDFATLRNNLLENLINLKIDNLHQNNPNFEIFEIGTVFNKNQLEKTQKESINLAFILGNLSFNQQTWQTEKNSLTWYQAKGQVEEIFEKLHIPIIWSTKKKVLFLVNNLSKYIHPTRSIYINYNNLTIGIFSQLNYRIYNNKIFNKDIYFFEGNIQQLVNNITKQNHLQYIYLPYPNYPKTTRDFSIEIEPNFSIQNIYQAIKSLKNTKKYIIESIDIMNEYFNKNNDRTICLRISYRSFCKTLTHTEIEIIEQALQKIIISSMKSKT